MNTSELAVGLNRGHKVQKLPKIKKHPKTSSSKRVKFVKELIGEVSGLAPYEKRAIELLKVNKDKKCVRFLKKKLGSITASKQRRNSLSQVLIAMKRKTH